MLSRNAQNGPTFAWRPHRLTLPLTVLVFLATWSASNFVGATQAPQLVAASDRSVADSPLVPDDDHVRPSRAGSGLPAIASFVKAGAGTSSAPALSATRSASAAIERTVRRTRAPLEVLGTPPDPLAPGSQPASSLAEHNAVGQAALGRIAFDWQSRLSGWTIDFRSANGSLRGLTFADQRRIEVYVHTDDVRAVAAVTAHELGHALDVTLNNTVKRRAWKEQRGMSPDTPWWPTAASSDFATGSGDFAECFATTQIGSASRSTYGACSARDLRTVQSLIGA